MSETVVAGEASVEVRDGPHHVSTVVLESIAECVHAMATAPGVEGLVEGQAVRLVLDPDLPSGIDGLATDTTIYVRPRGGASYVAILILHELAHILLARAGLPDTHGDVWILALALAAPRAALARLRAAGVVTAVGLAAAVGMPWWAASLRLDMTHVIPDRLSA